MVAQLENRIAKLEAIASPASFGDIDGIWLVGIDHDGNEIARGYLPMGKTFQQRDENSARAWGEYQTERTGR